MQTSPFLPAILLLPLAGAIAIAVLARKWQRTAVAAVACGAVLLAFLATVAALVAYLGTGSSSVTVLSQWQINGVAYQIALLGDALSLWFALVVTGVGFLIHVYSAGYMAHEDKADYKRYFAKLNFFIFAMSLLVLADSFLGMLMGWANVGLASYFLIGFYRQRPAASAAGLKAFVTNMVGEVGLITGIAAAIAHYGSATFENIWPWVLQNPEPATTIGLLLLIGAVAKSAQLPLQVWLPDAMQGPTPVSALIHAATMVTAGVYMVARAYPIYMVSETASMAVAVVGALSALVGAAAASRQFDIKRVLAYSTMSQLGFMFLGNGVGAYGAALFHFMTHAFFKALLFLAAGMVIHHLKGQQDIRRMGGLAKRMPYVYWVFLIGALALIGVPPFAGFFSKDEILNAVLDKGHPVLWLMGILAAGLTAFYNLRLLSLAFWGEPAAASPFRTGKRSRRVALAAAAAGTGGEHVQDSPSMAVPVGILAGLSAIAGFMALPAGWNLPEHFLGRYLNEYALPAAAEGHGVIWWAMGVVLLVAAAGAYAGWRLYGPGGTRRELEQASTGEPTGLLGTCLYLDEAYEWLAVRPTWSLSETAYIDGDGRLIDGTANGLGRLARYLGASLGWLHSGYLRRYALTMVAGLVAVTAYYVGYNYLLKLLGV